MELSEQVRARIDALLATCEEPREALIQALEIVQTAEGQVSDGATRYVANRLRVGRPEIDDVLSFYPAFSGRPMGRHVIRVCRGLPCALVGGESLAAFLSKRLGIVVGETTPDGRFTLLEVECLGLCDVAPAMMIDDRACGRLTPGRIDDLLSSFEGNA